MANAEHGHTRITETTMGLVAVSPADEIIDLVWDEEDPGRRVHLASSALAIDPDCIEAYLVLAQHTDNVERAAELLARAVTSGIALWAPIMKMRRGNVDWWDCVATRPYMRAMLAMGHVAAEYGDVESARKCFEVLIQMHPADALGARGELEKLNSSTHARII